MKPLDQVLWKIPNQELILQEIINQKDRRIAELEAELASLKNAIKAKWVKSYVAICPNTTEEEDREGRMSIDFKKFRELESITCPYCETERNDPWDDSRNGQSEDEIIKCKCGNSFIMRCSVSVTYDSYALCEVEGHEWEYYGDESRHCVACLDWEDLTYDNNVLKFEEGEG